jgi:hypothetical protein
MGKHEKCIQNLSAISVRKRQFGRYSYVGGRVTLEKQGAPWTGLSPGHNLARTVMKVRALVWRELLSDSREGS